MAESSKFNRMRCQIILRQAKSNLEIPNLDELARPLTRRGDKIAIKIGLVLARKYRVSDIVLVSSSIRTHTTRELFAPSLIHEIPSNLLRTLSRAL